ncbi:PREDICTED: uncharacterized protein LOC108566533 [Nicrophorus vespilloides]|uniref:Uncharacterized protein LOC108566533 n=1 Tax=Nicrophorus vespilloides TaxID=110193 RepID=A0ABM1N553_NICVS|nr:PREDICTED: uncharacterized protein LOC108566533 [Nicrophorus vespilloides]XP_017781953.1 PREDICTED: uncharacterized protein LOC108566533 [Nicrophorus vespilloides]
MSTELRESERQRMEDERTKAYKRSRFVRSSSLERIRKFNTYICSQNYYILPAILTWLRNSSTVIQTNFERSIIYSKATIYNSTVYKVSRICTKANISMYLDDFRDFSRHAKDEFCMFFSERLAICGVYATIVAIFVQLLVCLYTLCTALMPAGLVFMIGCLYYITHLNLKCLKFFIDQEAQLAQQNTPKKISTPSPVKTKRLSRKDILGKRTISNFNLF